MELASHAASSPHLEFGRTNHRAQQVLQANASPALASIPSKSPLTSNTIRRSVSSSGHGHSRSNSINGAREASVNYNRWSQSTTSSATSSQHRFSKRFSVGNSGPFAAFGSTSKGKRTESPARARSPDLSRPIDSHSTVQNSYHAFTQTPALSEDTVPNPFIDFSTASRGVGLTYRPMNHTSTTQTKIVPSSTISIHGTHQDYQRPSTSDASKSSRANRVALNMGTMENERRSRSRGHSRSRDAGSGGRSRDRSMGEKLPSQKAMLSKALQKANSAVLLDNAQDFDGAMEAYQEACNLLGQVMSRSSGDEDKRKLEAIRNTYTNRVKELNNMPSGFHVDHNKALPARPDSQEYPGQESAIIETAIVTHIINDSSIGAVDTRNRQSVVASHLPPRRESLRPTANNTSPSKSKYLDPFYTHSNTAPNTSTLKPPATLAYAPPPLSPHKPRSSSSPERSQAPSVSTGPSLLPPPKSAHSRSASTESISWLDTIDESGGSSASSVHSRSSAHGLRRKRIRAASGATEAEFDAALDAAVEAAYDDGFEPAVDDDLLQHGTMSNARRNVELAKERVREAEREAAVHGAKERERRRLAEPSASHSRNDSIELEYGDEEAAEEERMLEEMTRDYILDDFEFDLQTKSALPRQSDSSGFSGRTWGSSVGSIPTTGATSLRTLSEVPSLPSIPPKLQSKSTPPPPHPPPTAALPPPPPPLNLNYNSSFHLPPTSSSASPPPRQSSPSTSGSSLANHGVRSRRLSGQTHKQLKIETLQRPSTSSHAPISQPPSIPPPQIPSGDSLSAPAKTAPTFPLITPSMLARPPATSIPTDMRKGYSPVPDASPSDHVRSPSPSFSGLTKTLSQESIDRPLSRSGSPGRLMMDKKPSGGGILRKNFSSSSLKNRNFSVSSPEGSEVSPSTPLSTGFSATSSLHRKVPTPSVPALPPSSFVIPSLSIGGLYLFDTDAHSPNAPGSPNTSSPSPPAPLELCPSEASLRPYWLMRCVYQTLAHPKGGYLSTKLFIPREVWYAKVTKIKGLEEKISGCDLLTAALLKLDSVDTFDADAVLEEMQTLEHVLDTVQTALTKKLGSEVGVSSSLLKDGPAENQAHSSSADGSSIAGSSSYKGTGSSSKSSYLSWRRLRNKQSGAGLTGSFTGSKESSGRETPSIASMPTLPMAAVSPPHRTKVKRGVNVGSIHFAGPNANYMSALAKLCDAAQVLDQIARQVEDPGLKHSSSTQVGLELSTRHAADFFAFYVCRFVMGDLSLLVDKYLKRGAEWVNV